MKYETNCNCGVCKMTKEVGMHKHHKTDHVDYCFCGSGKKRQDCHDNGKE